MVSAPLEQSVAQGEEGFAATEAPEALPSLCPQDAVGSLFDAAGLPQRCVYGARAWCFRRGGDLAALARGFDPKALASAPPAPPADPPWWEIFYPHFKAALPAERAASAAS